MVTDIKKEDESGIHGTHFKRKSLYENSSTSTTLLGEEPVFLTQLTSATQKIALIRTVVAAVVVFVGFIIMFVSVPYYREHAYRRKFGNIAKEWCDAVLTYPRTASWVTLRRSDKR